MTNDREPVVTPEPTDPATIERSAVQGVSLVIARHVLVLALTAGATIALARILSPADYGAFAVAFAIQVLGKTAVLSGDRVGLYTYGISGKIGVILQFAGNVANVTDDARCELATLAAFVVGRQR